MQQSALPQHLPSRTLAPTTASDWAHTAANAVQQAAAAQHAAAAQKAVERSWSFQVPQQRLWAPGAAQQAAVHGCAGRPGVLMGCRSFPPLLPSMGGPSCGTHRENSCGPLAAVPEQTLHARSLSPLVPWSPVQEDMAGLQSGLHGALRAASAEPAFAERGVSPPRRCGGIQGAAEACRTLQAAAAELDEVLKQCPGLLQEHFLFQAQPPPESEPELPPPPRRNFYFADSEGYADPADTRAQMDCSAPPTEAFPQQVPPSQVPGPSFFSRQSPPAPEDEAGSQQLEYSLRVQIADDQWETLQFNAGDGIHAVADVFLAKYHVHSAFRPGLVATMLQMASSGQRQGSADIVDLI